MLATRDDLADAIDLRLLELRPMIEALAEQEARIIEHHHNMAAACEAAARKGTPLEAPGESSIIPALPAPRFQAAGPGEVAGPYGAAGYLGRRVMAMREDGRWPPRV
ncbi:hypothetical protein DYH09_35085 [bacterium CPR1]|nr:hypothetical protein [bacterium CPR1]